MFAVELIQSILLIISAILMIISAIGFLTLDKNMNNLIYARIHIVGVFDVATGQHAYSLNASVPSAN